MTEQPQLYFGPAGWSYPDWKGRVYPKGMKIHPLNFLEQYFSMVEINTTFYHLPDRKVTENWCLIPRSKDFLFTVKLGQRFTHVRKDITKQEKEDYREIFRIIRFYDRLGGVLVQFPWSFRNTMADYDYLKGLLDAFSEFPLFVEFRHSSWLKKEVFEYIHSRDTGYCNIDQPVIGNSIGLTDYVTSDAGYLRLHGRNTKEWFSKDTNRDLRYNYLYDSTEISELVEKLKKIIKKAKKVFVVGNNHFKGQAVKNLLQLKAELTGAPLVLPAGLKP
jgi:uncharacterized protein YecE (DUF72 family)